MNEDEGWVPVAEEPNHHEIFRNALVRAYLATLRPGERTAFHRHDEDTLYIVIAGGRSSTETMRGSAPYRFGRSVSLLSQLRMAAGNVLRNRVFLRDGMAMFMANRGRPIIHAVGAADDNPSSLTLMGIELLSRMPEATKRPKGGRTKVFMDAELVVGRAAVHRFGNEEELRSLFDVGARGTLIVATEGPTAGRCRFVDPGSDVGAIEGAWLNGFAVTLD